MVIALLLVFTGCSLRRLQSVAIEQLQQLEWLLGRWERSDLHQSGRQGIEIWERRSPTAFIGHGVLLQNRDTLFQERLRLLVKDRQLYFVADVAHNKASVFFKIQSADQQHFACENPTHDFPKTIRYTLQSEGALQATASGNGNKQEFLFRKIK